MPVMNGRSLTFLAYTFIYRPANRLYTTYCLWREQAIFLSLASAGQVGTDYCFMGVPFNENCGNILALFTPEPCAKDGLSDDDTKSIL